jgi:hypothetical protein
MLVRATNHHRRNLRTVRNVIQRRKETGTERKRWQMIAGRQEYAAVKVRETGTETNARTACSGLLLRFLRA